MLKLTDYIGLGNAEYSDELIGLRLSTRLHIGGKTGPSWRDVIISGVSPLALTNALGLNYIKALGATEQRNLPSEYTQLEYIALDGGCYFDTGFLANTTTTTYHTGITLTSVSGVGRGIFGSRNDASASTGSCNVFIMTTGVFRLDWTSSNSTMQTSSLAGVYYDIVCSRPKTTINGTTYSSNNTTSVDQQYSFLIGNFSNAGTGPYGNGFVGYIHFSELYSNGVLVHKYLPARRNSDGVLGLYDVVAGDFLTNQGSGTLTAGADATPTPDAPIDIVCNNGVVKLKNFKGNIPATITSSTAGADSLALDRTKTHTLSCYVSSDFTATNSYVFSLRRAGSGLINIYGTQLMDYRGRFFRMTFTNIDLVRFAINGQISAGSLTVVAITNGSTIADGTVETINVTNGGTANAEMLLKVGDYKDNQELLTGNVTRNVGVKVLDGTEIWTYKSLGSGIARVYIKPTIPGDTDLALCSHAALTPIIERTQARNPNTFQFGILENDQPYLGFKLYESEFADRNAWQNFLADQYNAGTPVIIIYPLATPTTETVTGQTLTASGNCTVTATGSLDNLSLEVSYKQGVVVRIQEASNENLDNNVNVTIS